MEITNKREKIIFTETEANAIMLVYKIMRDIEDESETDEVILSASHIADYLGDFVADNFADASCVVRQAVADSTREIQISIAIK